MRRESLRLKGMSYAEWAARWRVPLHFVLAALVVGFARPSGTWFAAGTVLVAVGLGVRAWAAGHIQKAAQVTTAGPYAYHRHPLYLGSALILGGFALAAARGWLAGLLAGYFLLLFVPALRREEEGLREQFPEEYRAYAAAVPAGLPRLAPARTEHAAEARFRWERYRANREWKGVVGCAVLWVLLYLRWKAML